MNSFSSMRTAIFAATATLLGAGAQAGPMPTNVEPMKLMLDKSTTEVRWRGGGYGYRGLGYGVGGAIIGGAVARRGYYGRGFSDRGGYGYAGLGYGGYYGVPGLCYNSYYGGGYLSYSHGAQPYYVYSCYYDR